MKKHTITYLNFFDYTIADFIECEMCKQRAVDIHHINNKGMGGSKTKDYIENLIALCRQCHDKAHNETFTKQHLTNIHLKNI